MSKVRIRHRTGVLKGVVEVPTSKSISNRLLILQNLPGSNIRISNLSQSDDTVLLYGLLEQIRLKPNSKLTLDCGNAGTVLRFLTALLSISPGEFILTGNERMKDRPIGPLVESLRILGADISCLEKEGYPPLKIRGRVLRGRHVQVDGTLSSQFITALMLIAPSLSEGLEIEMTGEPSSATYLKMSLELMRSLGFQVSKLGNLIRMGPMKSLTAEFEVDRDWSSATFFYEMALLSKQCQIRINNLQIPSIQGDSAISAWRDLTGIESRMEENGIMLNKFSSPCFDKQIPHFGGTPDLAIPFIVGCIPSRQKLSFNGLGTLLYKESNRIDALSEELKKINVRFREVKGSWILDASGLEIPQKVHFKHYNDHRIAMALAGLATMGMTIVMDDPGIVSKSFPDFWSEIQKTGFEVIEI